MYNQTLSDCRLKRVYRLITSNTKETVYLYPLSRRVVEQTYLEFGSHEARTFNQKICICLEHNDLTKLLIEVKDLNQMNGRDFERYIRQSWRVSNYVIESEHGEVIGIPVYPILSLDIVSKGVL